MARAVRGWAKSIPALADPFGVVQDALHGKDGFDAANDVCFVLMDVRGRDGDVRPQFLVLVPVYDYDAYLAAVRAGERHEAGADGGVTEVVLGTPYTKLFAVHRPGYAVMASDRRCSKTTAGGCGCPARWRGRGTNTRWRAM